jgi:hypothetical protein
VAPRIYVLGSAGDRHIFRHAYEADGGETVRGGKPYWFAEETKYWRDQRFKSLSCCLNPKYRKPK